MASSFLAPEVVEALANESSSSGSGRFINPSKLTGEKRVRFIGSGITGFGAWTTDKKPVRWPQKPAELPANIAEDLKGNKIAKRFLAGMVWDYEDQDFRILELTQKSLLDQLFRFIQDADYGDPQGYDIKVSKKGEGLDTQYTLVAAPPKPLAAEVAKAAENVQCDLAAMFDGKDPWASPSA